MAQKHEEFINNPLNRIHAQLRLAVMAAKMGKSEASVKWVAEAFQALAVYGPVAKVCGDRCYLPAGHPGGYHVDRTGNPMEE